MIYIYYFLSIFASISLITMIYQNQFFRIIWLILTFLNGAFLMILLDFNYIGLSYIIIYIGAIIILFLFVIQMINENAILDIPSHSKYIWILLLISIFQIFHPHLPFYYYFTDNYFTIYYSFYDINLIANMIFIHYPQSLFLIGYLLLILLLGVLKLLI